MYRGHPDPYLILGPQPAPTLDPLTVVISSLFVNPIQCTFTYPLLHLLHELSYPQCVGAGFSSSYPPLLIWPYISFFCLSEQWGHDIFIFSSPLSDPIKHVPLLKAFTIQPMLTHVQHPPPICRQFNSALANVCIDLLWPGITKFYLVTLSSEHSTFCCQQPDTDPDIPVLIISLSIKHSILGSCRLTDVPDLGVQWLCLARHVSRSCVYEPITLCSFHTHHLPATWHPDIKKQLFVHSSIHPFAHGGVMNTLASHYHDGTSTNHFLMVWWMPLMTTSYDGILPNHPL